MNWYAYAYNNPVSFVDADGRSPTLITGAVGAVGGAVFGGAYAYATGGDWKHGAVSGAIAGGVTGLTLGAGGAAIAGLVNGGVAGGALAGGSRLHGGECRGTRIWDGYRTSAVFRLVFVGGLWDSGRAQWWSTAETLHGADAAGDELGPERYHT